MLAIHVFVFGQFSFEWIIYNISWGGQVFWKFKSAAIEDGSLWHNFCRFSPDICRASLVNNVSVVFDDIYTNVIMLK